MQNEPVQGIERIETDMEEFDCKHMSEETSPGGQLHDELERGAWRDASTTMIQILWQHFGPHSLTQEGRWTGFGDNDQTYTGDAA